MNDTSHTPIDPSMGLPEHPDVTLARQHRERREWYETIREREPEPDVAAEVRQLATIVERLCHHAMWVARRAGSEDAAVLEALRDDAQAIAERLA